MRLTQGVSWGNFQSDRDAADNQALPAAGQVWLSDLAPSQSRLVWGTANGRYRTLGDRPPGAEPAEPGVEDGYLLLVGEAA